MIKYNPCKPCCGGGQSCTFTYHHTNGLCSNYDDPNYSFQGNLFPSNYNVSITDSQGVLVATLDENFIFKQYQEFNDEEVYTVDYQPININGNCVRFGASTFTTKLPCVKDSTGIYYLRTLILPQNLLSYNQLIQFSVIDTSKIETNKLPTAYLDGVTVNYDGYSMDIQGVYGNGTQSGQIISKCVSVGDIPNTQSYTARLVYVDENNLNNKTIQYTNGTFNYDVCRNLNVEIPVAMMIY